MRTAKTLGAYASLLVLSYRGSNSWSILETAKNNKQLIPSHVSRMTFNYINVPNTGNHSNSLQLRKTFLIIKKNIMILLMGSPFIIYKKHLHNNAFNRKLGSSLIIVSKLPNFNLQGERYILFVQRFPFSECIPYVTYHSSFMGSNTLSTRKTWFSQ